MTQRVPIEAKLLLSPREASALTGIGLAQCYRFCQDGTWPCIRIGIRYLVARATIEAWIARQAQPLPLPALRRAR